MLGFFFVNLSICVRNITEELNFVNKTEKVVAASCFIWNNHKVF